MNIDYKDIRDHKVILLHGDVDYFCVSDLKNAVFKLINDRAPSIILDLNNVEYMDSSGIGLIVTAYKVMNQYGGRMGLVNVQDDVMKLLRLTTIDTLIKIYSSEQEIV
jgi:anti-sigma B factor antagonist